MANEPQDAIEPGADGEARPDQPAPGGGVNPADGTVSQPAQADASHETARDVTHEPARESETATEARAGEDHASDDMGDAAGIRDRPDSDASQTSAEALPLNCDRELSAQRVAVELKRIEAEVRKLLEDRDPKRKRRLAGSRRWRELEEDLIALRFTGRMEESTIAALRRLINRRHYLFGRLRFLALTRPTWNS